MALDKNQLLDFLLNKTNFENDLPFIEELIVKLQLKPDYPIILVGGTNGKGSTCAYLTTILTLAGFKVGSFTSPHVLSYNERISINNKPIDDINLANALDYIIKHSQDSLGLFKTFTLAAHHIFIHQKIDVAIIEVGIGGKNDVTNLFEPDISIITNVHFDHGNILGNTLDEIGLQKAGIFRPNIPCLFGSPNIPQSVIDHAKAISAHLEIANIDFGYTKHELGFAVWNKRKNFFSLPFPALRGNEQLQNATLALTTLSHLAKFPVGLTHIKTGLLQVRLLGRFQTIPGLPQTILDVAHNVQAVSNMLQNMLKLPFVKNNFAVFGIADDKDIKGVIKQCQDKFNHWFIAPIKSPRSVTTNKLNQILNANNINNISIADSIEKAYKQALLSAKNEDRIICFGSFLVVEEVYNSIYDKNQK